MTYPGSFNDLVDAIPGYALKTAATLRIADHLADGHRSIDALATASNTNPEALERLMRYLCSREIFTRTAQSGYLLTDFSRLLLDDHPARLRRSLDLDGYSGRMDQAIALLPDVIRTGKPSYPDLFGQTFYSDYAAAPEIESGFADIRQRQAQIHGADVARTVSIAAGAHVVDVGGGTGALIASLLAHRRDLTATVFDLPGLEVDAISTLRASGSSSGRAGFVAGDFFDSVPSGDLHILSNTLFNWDDDHAAAILRNTYRASTTGRILIIEQMPDSLAPTEEELALDLRNLVLNGGRQRNREQFSQIAHAATLRISTTTQLSYRSLYAIELSSDPPPATGSYPP